jgi:uncharacterized membrane protein
MTGAQVVTVAAALCSAVVAGAFLVFSTFVMHGLGRLPSAEGIAAMQSINVSAVRPSFMTTLFGTAVVCAAAAVMAWGDEGGGVVLAGAALYLLGTIGVTIVGNVPLNNQLAMVRPAAGEAAAVWRRYLTVWTNLNHVRTVSSLAAGVLFAVAVT